VKYVLYFYMSTFRSLYAVPNIAVYCSSLISCFPGMLLKYCQCDFEMDPVAPIITGIIIWGGGGGRRSSTLIISNPVELN
jgi:hypothetical protein